MKRKYNVYGIGNALVDIVTEVSDDFLESHSVEKNLMTLVDENKQNQLSAAINMENSSKQCGGSAANTIIGVSQFGGSSYYACRVGSDEMGKFFLSDMLNNGVDTNLKEETLPQGITGKCLVMTTPDAARTMNTFLGITSEFSTAELDEDVIADSEYIYIEGYLVTSDDAREAMQTAISVARKHDTKVALTFSDPSMVKFFGPQMREVVSAGVDLLFCNMEEALLFAETEDEAEAVAKLKTVAKEFVITKSEEGATIYHGEEVIQVAPNKVEAIDTNGAGDCFAGAYLYGITNGLSRQQAGDLASAASAKVVTQFGPRLTKEQAHELLKSR
ncbi:MAG: adenosine kinase [Bacteroidota bacterium]